MIQAGHDATLRIHDPALLSAPHLHSKAGQADSSQDHLPETLSMRVLLVEDHKPLVRALRQGLEEENFAVDVAMDGEDADVKARNTDYDVVILDLMLPKIDG